MHYVKFLHFELERRGDLKLGQTQRLIACILAQIKKFERISDSNRRNFVNQPKVLKSVSRHIKQPNINKLTQTHKC